MLDRIRANDDLSFPSSLHLLRNSTAIVSQMAHCQHCPARYLSAVQNMQLLIALIMTMADQYGAILGSIDEEARRLAELGKPKLLLFTESGAMATDTELNTDAYFSLETSPSEWRALAKKAVKSEIFGRGENSNSFAGLLDFLEERQTMWHTVGPCSNRRRENVALQEEPLCIKLIQRAKRRSETLGFGETEETTDNPLGQE
jgi:hypothetical protein